MASPAQASSQSIAAAEPYTRAHCTRPKRSSMHARIARFEGDPAGIDESISRVRGNVESGSPPPGLEGTKMMMLVNRETGHGLGITLFDSEDAMRRGDEALNAMDAGPSGARASVDFY